MTEDMKAVVRRVGGDLVAPAVIALTGLAGYAYQQGRAAGYGAHFGVHYSAADARLSAVPLAFLLLTVAAVLWALVLALRAGAMLLAPGAVLLFVPMALVIPPYSWGQSALRLGVVVGLWVLLAVGKATLPRVGRAILNFGETHRGRLVFRTILEMNDRYDSVRIPTAPFAVAVVGAGLLYGSWHLGTYDGGYQAAHRTDFDVLRHDGRTATVVFTRSGDIVQRTLNISPGADGQPVNQWEPEIVIRPMPDSGHSFRTIRLGRTEKAAATRP